MSGARYTAGPWVVAMIDGGAADDEIVAEVGGVLVNIAAVFGQGEYSEARPNGEPELSYSVSADEAKANGRLIAAAQSLLEALEIVRPLIECPSGRVIGDFAAALKVIEDAIRLAKEGE